MKAAPVSVIVPVHNGAGYVEKLLASLARQTAAPAEIIVVDNASTDDAPEMARRAGARVIAMDRNAGFAAAVNRGIQEASGQGIALINSDVELDPDWIEILWDSIRGSDKWFATGKILSAANGAILDGSYDLICRGGCAWRAGAGKRVQPSLDRDSNIQFCSATASIYRAEIFRKIGLFEEAFESYLEDVDFGLRCAAAGITGGYFPAAVCRHWGSATLGPWSPRVARLISRNQLYLVARHYDRELTREWLWPILTAQILWGGVAVRHGCGAAWITGKLQGIRRFSAMRANAQPSHRLRVLISESERQIYDLQSEIGFDAYWKLYFRFTGRPR